MPIKDPGTAPIAAGMPGLDFERLPTVTVLCLSNWPTTWSKQRRIVQYRSIACQLYSKFQNIIIDENKYTLYKRKCPVTQTLETTLPRPSHYNYPDRTLLRGLHAEFADPDIHFHSLDRSPRHQTLRAHRPSVHAEAAVHAQHTHEWQEHSSGITVTQPLKMLAPRPNRGHTGCHLILKANQRVQ